MIRKIHLVAAATAAVLCAACDTHIDVPDTAVRPGHILCENGTALPYAQYEQSWKKANEFRTSKKQIDISDHALF